MTTERVTGPAHDQGPAHGHRALAAGGRDVALTPAVLLTLQRSAGNRAVARVVADRMTRPSRPVLQRAIGPDGDGKKVKERETGRLFFAVLASSGGYHLLPDDGGAAFEDVSPEDDRFVVVGEGDAHAPGGVGASSSSPTSRPKPQTELKGWPATPATEDFGEGMLDEQLVEDTPETLVPPPLEASAPASNKRRREREPKRLPSERQFLPLQTPSYRSNARIRELITTRLGQLLETGRMQAPGREGEKAYRESKKGPGAAEQRSLDRLAWVLAHLKDARECVAVTIVTIDDASASLFAWANKQDDAMLEHMRLLIAAARTSAEDSAQALEALWAAYEKSKLDYRKGKPQADDWHAAERRLLKTLRFLREFQDKVGQIEPKTVHPKYVAPAIASGESNKRAKVADQKVHAEQRGADLIKITKEEQAKKRTDGDEPMTDPDERWRFMFGISKLCCFHCDRGLKSLAQTAGIEIATTGSHFTTYGDWPIPAHLRGAREVRAFLGVPEGEKERSEADVEVAAAIEKDLPFVLDVIRGYKGTGGLETTDYVSSEDEDDLEFEKFPQEDSSESSDRASS